METSEQGSSRAQRKQVLLRLDPAVHEALARWASDDLRSVNAQIEMILRRAPDPQARSAPEGVSGGERMTSTSWSLRAGALTCAFRAHISVRSR